MNYKKIQEKYPKAFAEFEKWWCGDMCFFVFAQHGNIVTYRKKRGDYDSDRQFTNIRELYDFFDGQDIYISIAHGSGLTKNNNNPFQVKVGIESVFREENALNFPTRPLAEEAAFKKAFEELEKKLSKK